MRKLTIVLLIFLLFSCRDRMKEEAELITGRLTLDQKIGQMIMVGVPGKKLTDKTAAIIEKYKPGGIILFGFNIGDENETRELIADLQQEAFSKYNIPLFISIDQEGGRVKRIRKGVAQFPGNMALGVVDDESMTCDAAEILGKQLVNMGVNMNLAPDLDVNNNPSNPVINTRSFGSDPEVVARLGKAYIKGLQKSGCVAVAKHFPGHGDTDKDSHRTLPVINYDMTRLHEVEFRPFVEAIDSDVEAIMTAHISFPKILNDDLPATLSEKFLTDILRGEMKFDGIIITDDMEMGAISKTITIGEGAVKSVLAGSDIILISTHGENIESITGALKDAVNFGKITEARIDESVKRIIEVKLRYNIMSLEEGAIVVRANKSNTNESEILKKADEVNAGISREAIYYFSSGVPDAMNENPRIFITSNELFTEAAESKLENILKIFKRESDFISYMDKKKIKDKIDIYYQFDSADPIIIEKLCSMCKKSGLNFYLLCTGNPFLLKNVKELPPAYFTFSNTEESLKQLALCLNGDFKPKIQINFDLGFNKDK